jgi:hypothetical protein
LPHPVIAWDRQALIGIRSQLIFAALPIDLLR